MIIDKNEEDSIIEMEKKYEVMEQSMLLLGEPCLSIINDYYINKLSLQEIVDKMGYTNANNAKNQKYKCLQRLKKIFFSNYKKDRKNVVG